MLADFGIARRVHGISGLTATNMTIGTLSYAAPEQLIGAALARPGPFRRCPHPSNVQGSRRTFPNGAKNSQPRCAAVSISAIRPCQQLTRSSCWGAPPLSRLTYAPPILRQPLHPRVERLSPVPELKLSPTRTGHFSRPVRHLLLKPAQPINIVSPSCQPGHIRCRQPITGLSEQIRLHPTTPVGHLILDSRLL